MPARCLVLVLLQLVACNTWAHGLRLAFLEGVEHAPGTWQLALRVPVLGDRVWPLGLDLPPACKDLRPATSRPLPSGDLAVQRTVQCDPGAHDIGVTGIQAGVVDLLVRLEDRGGNHSVHVVTGTDAHFTLEASANVSLLARIGLGLRHILTGYDHLAFVAGIVLLLQRPRNILISVTAFTLAHSITLSLAALGLVNLPQPPVETVIALSIVYLAAEIVQSHRRPGAQPPIRRVWAAALGFGLLHGFGFASALREAGVPDSELPVTLVLFNLGIEVGQLAFVAVLVAGLDLARRLVVLAGARAGNALPRLHVIIAYGLGSIASFWTIQRLAGFV